MSGKQSSLFTDYEINGKKLSNRFTLAPMTRVSATEEGLATPEMVSYYERFAEGGFGLIITEGIYTDQKYSQGYHFQPGISTTAQAQSWKEVVDAIHQHSALAFAQLIHAGALNQGNRFTDHSIAPSAFKPKGKQMTFYYGDGEYAKPREMSVNDISDAIRGFVDAAVFSINEADFDGIEIHAANGYLLDQFLTDYTNTRSDNWGGSVEKRIALTLEVYKEIRSAVGDNVPVGVRISQGKVNDFDHKWAGGEQDAAVIFGALANAGVDYIHVTEYEAWKPAFGNEGPSLVELARRYAPNTTIIANGGLHDMDRADSALATGADIIAIGKAALSNPDLPHRIKEGIELKAVSMDMLSPIANIKEFELSL